MNRSGIYGKVRRAIQAGIITRPDLCQRCGSQGAKSSDGRSTIHAHHNDYSKPLDIEWICAKCHRAETPLPEKMGAAVFGVRNGQAKLSESAIAEAFRMRKLGMTYQKIAANFGVNHTTIRRALVGTHWIAAAQGERNAD